MGKRGPRRQISEEQLLDAALAVVAESGLPGLSMSALARELEVSVSGLYRYVDDLGDLFQRLQTRALVRYDEGLVDHLAATVDLLAETRKGSAQVRTLVLALEGFLFFLVHRHHHLSEHRLLDSFLSDPAPVLSHEAAAAVGAQIDAILNRCGAPLEEAANSGALDPGDTPVRTHLVWAALHGLMHFEKRDRIQPPRLVAEALVIPLLKALLVGFGAQASSVDKAFELRAELSGGS